MSDDTEKPNEIDKKPGEAENKTSTELSNQDLAQVTGGVSLDGIKGESTDDKHKDWIEIL